MPKLHLKDLNRESAPMKTPLHQSAVTKVFALYLREGETKDCGCSEPPEAFFQVIEGAGTILLGEEALVAEAGELVICPAGVPHRLEANRGSPFRLLVIRPLKQ